MFARCTLAAVVILVAIGQVWGQAAAPSTNGGPANGWRNAAEKTDPASTSSPLDPAVTPGSNSSGPKPGDPKTAQPPPPANDAPRRRIARVTEGNGSLPNTHSQVWREYDISPYTLRVTTTNRPEQAIVDWILRETGYEAWHGEPLGILSATSRTLRVYHTPEMQNVVAEIVDRFVSSQAESSAFGLRMVTLDQPNWRTRSQRLLRPVAVQTPGVGAWLVQKEDAVMFLAELRRRSDYREHSSPHLLVNNGQSTAVTSMRSRNYVRDVALRPDVWPGYQSQPAQVDEGFSLEFTPLLSVDGRMIDATIKCEIDQVEKMIPVSLDVPTVAAPRQRTQIEVPQISRCRFHERFRWPVDQVLLVALGMVPMPLPADSQSLIPGLPLPLGTSPPRADLLIFIESKGETGQASRAAGAAEREAKSYRGRY